MFCFLFCVFRVSVLFLPMYTFLYFLFVYNFTDHCYQGETHFQLINIISNTQSTTQCTHKCNNQVHLHNHSCLGRALSIIYSEYVSAALRYQCAMYMCFIILPSVSCLAKPIFFPNYLLNVTIFEGKVT
jgi:hypothetical protein